MIDLRLISLCLAVALLPGTVAATLTNGGSFAPSAAAITFATPGDGGATQDPSYTLATPGGAVTVSFAAYFDGQTLDLDFPYSLAPHQPSNPLTLAHNALATAEITDDGEPLATNPVLSGPFSFLGPIAIRFSVPVLAAGLRVGYLDDPGTITIEAYDADGNSLGTVTSTEIGFETFNLSLSAPGGISGLSIFGEIEQFAIDDVTFKVAALPEPATMGILALSFAGTMLLRRNIRRR